MSNSDQNPLYIRIDKAIFYQYLKREISAKELFDFIYATPALKDELTEEQYLNLLGFEWSGKISKSKIDAFLFEICLDKGEWIATQIIGILERFIYQPENFKPILQELYEIYEDSNPDGNDVNDFHYGHSGCTFLEYIGGSYFAYIQTSHYDSWRQLTLEEEVLEEVEEKYGHTKLRPVAEKIKTGLERGVIVIRPDGTYEMGEEFQKELREMDVWR